MARSLLAPIDFRPQALFHRDVTQRLVHDLRNPLAGLSSNLAYLEERLRSQPEPEVREALLDCRVAVARLRRLATMLVDLGALEEGSFRPRPALGPVAPLIQDLFAQRKHEASMRDLELRAEVPQGLSACYDPETTQRLLHSIFDYVLRYAQSNGVVNLSASTDDKERLLIRIEAPGEWLPRAEREYSEWFPESGRRHPLPDEVSIGFYCVMLTIMALGGSLRVLASKNVVIELILGGREPC